MLAITTIIYFLKWFFLVISASLNCAIKALKKHIWWTESAATSTGTWT